MRKCPKCAQENTNEKLFCKHCGRCLIAPEPEAIRRSAVVHTEQYQKPNAIDFYYGHVARNSGVATLKRKHDIKLSLIVKWLLFVNLLVAILMSQVVIR